MAGVVHITINGRRVEAEAGMTVLEAATREGIYIPTLCYHEALEPEGTCRLCLVEVSGSVRHGIRVSCIQEAQEGLVVETDTERVIKNRRLILELLLGRTPYSKPLLDLAARCGVTSSRFRTGENDDCVRCGRCVRVCRDKIGVHALCWAHRGYHRKVTTDFERLSETCIGCGACAQVCPTGAIRVEDRGDERKIFTWGQVLARFKLERCEHCGTPFAPKRYLDLINERAYKPKGLELINYICPECYEKKERASEKRRDSSLLQVVKWSVPRT
jgi:NADH dehydrogenase/NADH:ubiquinone oxidoreductase subunit G